MTRADPSGLNPRVHITYKIQTGDAEPLVELPFLMGVLAPLRGDRPIQTNENEGAKPLEDRVGTDVGTDIEDIDAGNFDSVMAKIAPEVVLKNGTVLKFRSMEDFGPGKLAERLESTKELMSLRNDLKALLRLTDGHARAEQAFCEILRRVKANPDLLRS